jgi:hypothetical protein
MLKRDGKPIERREVPGTSERLTATELAAYNATFATIERDFKQIEDIKGQLEKLGRTPLEQSDSKTLETVTTANGKNWNAQAVLMNLPKGEILLCREPEGNQWAIVQRLNTAGRYAQSQARSEWCGQHGVANGILRKPGRGQKLRPATLRVNRLFSSIRCKIEKVFGWWKRSAGYRRVRYVGHEPNRLELEFKSICWNLKRLATLSAA